MTATQVCYQERLDVLLIGALLGYIMHETVFEWTLLLGVVAIFPTIPYVTDHNFTDKTSYKSRYK